MASHEDFVIYTVEQMEKAGDIYFRKMFGEYGIYCDGLFFAVVCEDQLFVKITSGGESMFPGLSRIPPYKGARDYFLVEDIEDRQMLKELVCITCKELAKMKGKNDHAFGL